MQRRLICPAEPPAFLRVLRASAFRFEPNHPPAARIHLHSRSIGGRVVTNAATGGCTTGGCKLSMADSCQWPPLMRQSGSRSSCGLSRSNREVSRQCRAGELPIIWTIVNIIGRPDRQEAGRWPGRASDAYFERIFQLFVNFGPKTAKLSG